MTDPDMRVEFCGQTFKNPIVTASGTFGFGREYAEWFDLSELGGITVKGITPQKRTGNPAPRIAETPMGILNSVGLQNPGIDAFIEEELPFLLRFDTKIIANISGNTVEEYRAMAEKICTTDVDLVEMNISCPNVKAGGMAFGTDCAMVGQVVTETRKVCTKPLIVKLSPNVTDIAEIARVCEASGADAVSLINTILGMRIDVNTRRPVLQRNTGGLSGPAVLPVAVRMIYQVRQAVSIPIIGMGGVMTGEDAVELMLAGADLVAVGTANLVTPTASIDILHGLKDYLSRQGISSARELTGAVNCY